MKNFKPLDGPRLLVVVMAIMSVSLSIMIIDGMLRRRSFENELQSLETQIHELGRAIDRMCAERESRDNADH